MSKTCPECGAKIIDDTSCQEIFDQFLALEFSDPEYGAVHFLTVACFMTQHGRYSDEGLVWIKDKLHTYLEEELSGEQIRRLAAQDTSSGERSWRVTRSKNAPPAPRVNWSLTIQDVAANYLAAPAASAAETYRDWITRWARATLKQL